MRKAIGTGLAALFLSAQALAETQFGVEVYPGAKADAKATEQIRKAMKLDGQFYRTGDSVEKVTAFYRKQPLKEMPGADKAGAAFSGKGVMVTIQNPWMDMESGKINKDTLLSIVKQ